MILTSPSFWWALMLSSSLSLHPLCSADATAQSPPPSTDSDSPSSRPRSPQRSPKADAKPTKKLKPKSATRAPLNRREAGVISRADMTRYFKRGPQAFIAELRIKPTFKRGQFHGFQLSSISPQSPLIKGGLEVGDVILKVNGEAIGRPEEWMKAWRTVERAYHLSVTFEREGALQKFVWRVR